MELRDEYCPFCFRSLQDGSLRPGVLPRYDPQDSFPSHYEVLGIDITASARQVDEAFMKGGHVHFRLTDLTEEERNDYLRKAHEVLGDPVRRAGYDRGHQKEISNALARQGLDLTWPEQAWILAGLLLWGVLAGIVFSGRGSLFWLALPILIGVFAIVAKIVLDRLAAALVAWARFKGYRDTYVRRVITTFLLGVYTSAFVVFVFFLLWLWSFPSP